MKNKKFEKQCHQFEDVFFCCQFEDFIGVFIYDSPETNYINQYSMNLVINGATFFSKESFT